MNGKREFGDYQTPQNFAKKVVDYISFAKGIVPELIVEPTCGVGHFIEASLALPAKSIVGIEINEEYCKRCMECINDKRVEIINTDFFGFDLRKLTKSYHNVLVIGNPPWVTNSTLSSLNSRNLPLKVNFKRFKGMDAITGASNFDICEYMILQVIHSLRGSNSTVAMLCKTSVARNIFIELKRSNIAFSEYEVLEFDAATIFGINASACVLIIRLSDKLESEDICTVYNFEDSTVKNKFGYVNGIFFNNVDMQVPDYNGHCEFEWRQGIKHDCSKVMELERKGKVLINGLGEEIDIEDTIVYPLIKSSMIKTPVISSFTKYVVVTQRKSRDNTEYLSILAPKTWKYLNDYADLFDKRKSSIYRDAPKFSMFGVGDYSFSSFKVVVSGFYKTPLFSVLFSPDGKTVMTDDTNYFICFDSYDKAYVAMLVLNSETVQTFLKSIAFLDAKRPYTKKVLERLSFIKILQTVVLDDLKETEKKLGISQYITRSMLDDFLRLPELNDLQLTLTL